MTLLNSFFVLAAGLNITSTLIAVAALAVFILLAFFVYRVSLPPVYPTPEPLSISGGLILIALVLVLRQFTALWGLSRMDVWGTDFWENINLRFEGGQALLLKFVIVAELITNTFLVVGTGFLLVLFFKTRDIFPRTFMIILIAQEVFMLLDTLFVNLMFDGLATENTSALIAQSVGRWFVIILMVSYVMRSGRSQSTFVLPHSSLVNYDDPEFLTDLEEENKNEAL